MVFSALPHKSSGERVVPLIEDRSRVVDLSADFRLRSPAEYEEWYNTPHASAALQEEAVYGLTELYRSEIETARLIANPGCYPTSAILALAPLIKEKLVEPVIIVDCKSGVSGAGRGSEPEHPLLRGQRKRQGLRHRRPPTPPRNRPGGLPP